MNEPLAITLPEEVIGAIVEAVTQQVLEQLADREDHGKGWPEWMSVETAARYLDCSPERLRKLVARREIPFTQQDVGCRVFLRRLELDRWMDALRVEPRGGGGSPRLSRQPSPPCGDDAREGISHDSRTAQISAQPCGAESDRLLAERAIEEVG